LKKTKPKAKKQTTILKKQKQSKNKPDIHLYALVFFSVFFPDFFRTLFRFFALCFLIFDCFLVFFLSQVT